MSNELKNLKSSNSFDIEDSIDKRNSLQKQKTNETKKYVNYL